MNKVKEMVQIDQDTWELKTRKYDFSLHLEEDLYVLTIFDHKIKDNQEAFLEQQEFETLEEAKDFVKKYK